MGTDLTDERCSPTLPEQGQKSRSGDSNQGQPDKSTGMRQVQGKAGKSSQGVGVTEVQVSLQHGSGKEDQGPEMRLLPALSPEALRLDPGSLCSWVGHRGEVAEPGGALRVMKLMEKVELFQMVNEDQSLWKSLCSHLH